MKTDKQPELPHGADSEFPRLLTDGIRIDGPYRFEALDAKALERRIDGVLIPDATDQAPDLRCHPRVGWGPPQ